MARKQRALPGPPPTYRRARAPRRRTPDRSPGSHRCGRIRLKLYRVFPHDDTAAPTNRGGALFVPAGSRGQIDNPDLYRVLYASSHPEGAVAEIFGRLAIWKAGDFVHANGNPYALATYDLADAALIFDLDDIDAMRSLHIQRPTSVITRDRRATQAWAREIYARHDWIGAGWWSYYDPSFKAFGLWDISLLALAKPPEPITVSSPCVIDAATTIIRQIDAGLRR
ncbi:RES domain-containing protein [bacterium]|nr:MAG: RES domain-containing protein [bacterium]